MTLTTIENDNVVQASSDGAPSSPHDFASLMLGQFVNEIRFRMEVLWMIGHSQGPFWNGSIPWGKLIAHVRSLEIDKDVLESLEQNIETARNDWRECFTSEWHHEEILSRGCYSDNGSCPTDSECRELLSTFNFPISGLSELIIEAVGPSRYWYDLGIAVSQVQYPVRSERFLRVPLQEITASADGESDQQKVLVESMLEQLNVGLTCDAFIERFAVRPDDSAFLGLLLLDGGCATRNDLPPVQLQRQQFRLLKWFTEKRSPRLLVEDLVDDWQEINQRFSSSSSVSPRTVQRAIQNLSREIGALDLEIACPNRGLGYVLRAK